MTDEPVLLWLFPALLSLLVFAPSADAQEVLVRNDATAQVSNSGVWDLQGAVMGFGSAGSTARLKETSGGRVAGGLLTAARVLNSPSSADPAGLGAVLSASVDLGEVIVIRGDAAQSGSGNESIRRYYDISPSKNNSGLSATLTHSYHDAELNSLSESNLELFKSTDGGSTWTEEGYDSRDASANTVTLSGIGSFSRWTLGSESAPLPVELAAFEGTVTEGGVDLTWQTTSETGNAGFEVQRKRAGASGEAAWTKIGFVDGAGSTSELKSYSFTDTDLPYAADSLSYRLRQVDVDGTASVSDLIRIERTVDEVKLLGTYPNPARSRATVRFAVPGRQKAILRLYDVMGREVRTVVRGPQEGRNQLQLGLSDLPSGVYFLRLSAGGETSTQKLTVVR